MVDASLSIAPGGAPAAEAANAAARLPVTVVVPVKNEAANLGPCLSRLGRFEKVVVVDSSSTDATPEIAARHGAEVVNFTWDGRYPKKRNWLLLTQPPSSEWVLFLDADELVSEGFCDALAATLPATRHNGFWLNYTNYFLGRALKHGLPQRKLALFRVGSGLYERIDEAAWSALDMEVHEHPVITGTIGEIAARIEHYDDRGLLKFIDRHRDYALWEAQRTLLLRKQGAQGELTGRQTFKYKHLDAWWYAPFYFAYAYFLRGGLLDGFPGFYYAFQKAWYFSLVRVLIGELEGRVPRGPRPPEFVA